MELFETQTSSVLESEFHIEETAFHPMVDTESIFSHSYQILGLWKDVELGHLLLVAHLLIAYDLPASPISALNYWANKPEIVTVSRMFLGLLFFTRVNFQKYF